MSLPIYIFEGVEYVCDPYSTKSFLRRDIFEARLRVECLGYAEFEEISGFGTYELGVRLEVGLCSVIEEAMRLAEDFNQNRLSHMRKVLSDALDIRLMLFAIRDDKKRLVLGGSVDHQKLVWLEPVRESETPQLLKDIDDLLSCASDEIGWDNFSTGQGLRDQANRLRHRIIDPFWKGHARQAFERLQQSVTA